MSRRTAVASYFLGSGGWPAKLLSAVRLRQDRAAQRQVALASQRRLRASTARLRCDSIICRKRGSSLAGSEASDRLDQCLGIAK